MQIAYWYAPNSSFGERQQEIDAIGLEVDPSVINEAIVVIVHFCVDLP